MVGGDVFERSLECIAWNGRLLVIGFASGEIPSVKLNRILLKTIVAPDVIPAGPARLRVAAPGVASYSPPLAGTPGG